FRPMMTTACYPLDGEGVWCEVFSSGALGQPALFLDRDGVVVEEVDYLHRVEDITLCEDAAAVVAAANRSAIAVVLVTNQAGIGRDYYGWADFLAVQQAIHAAMADKGARFDAVYACPYHREARAPLCTPITRRESPTRGCYGAPPRRSRSTC